MKPLPDGVLMPLEEFLDGCYLGYFTDDDGVGYYATENEMTDISVCPSHYPHRIKKEFSHVVWFNK